jgi:hypothetical protein
MLGKTQGPPDHQQCDVNYREIRRATVWFYEIHRRIDGRIPPAEVMRPYEKLPIPTDLAIVHITLLVDPEDKFQWPPAVGVRKLYRTWRPALGPNHYRGTSLTRNRRPLGPYSRTMPRALWGS